MVLLLAIKSAFKSSLGILCKEASVISITLFFLNFSSFFSILDPLFSVVCLSAQVIDIQML